MIHILCYGDSNTYGLTPDWSGRYPWPVRWPGALQALLGADYHVAEDGLIGRTSAFPDRHRPGRSALDLLPIAIECHSPLDYLLLLLGTNDCKTEKTRTAEEAAAGMERLLDVCRKQLPPETRLVLITPPPLHAPVLERDPDFDARSVAVSEALGARHRSLTARYGCGYLDAGAVTRASDEDGEHLDAQGHAALAAAAANMILHDRERGNLS